MSDGCQKAIEGWNKHYGGKVKGAPETNTFNLFDRFRAELETAHRVVIERKNAVGGADAYYILHAPSLLADLPATDALAMAQFDRDVCDQQIIQSEAALLKLCRTHGMPAEIDLCLQWLDARLTDLAAINEQ